MNLKFSPFLVILIGAALVTLVGYSWFLNSVYFPPIYTWAQQYKFVLIPLVMLIKVVGILWPPIPGGLISLALIPMVGFVWAYVADLSGMLIGAALAYYIGNRFGETFIKRLVGPEIAEQAKRIKIKEGREIEAIIVLRIVGAGFLVEAISFGAGLLKIKFHKFMIGTFIGHLILIMPAFFIYSKIYQIKNAPFMAALLLLSIPLLWKLKDRYFE